MDNSPLPSPPTPSAPRAFVRLALVSLPLLGSGCVAFNVGGPERLKLEVPAGEAVRATSRKAVYSQAVAERDRAGAGLFVSLRGVVESGEQKCRIVDEIDVVRQKRLAFGLYPAMAEKYLRPEDSLFPNTPAEIGPFVVFGILLVPYNLLVEPFAGDWDCGDHIWIEGNTDPYAGPLGRAWCRRPNGDGIRPRPNSAAANANALGPLFSHTVPFGFFRYAVYRPSAERFKEAVPISAATFRREDAIMGGPYGIDVSVPAIGFSERRSVPAGSDRAGFRLPAGATAADAVALVRCRPPEGGLAAIRDESQRALLEDAMRWTHVVPLGPLGTAARVVVAVDAVRSAPIRYLREKDDAEGRSVYRAEILDETKDAFEVAAFVRPLLLAELRAEYAERHPGLDAASVRAWADYVTGDDGSSLVFSGAAFSVQPVADGWRYDAASRRGTVRLRLSAEADLADARRWARENVESIVRDRGATLSSGAEPPPGATFRSLSERFADGILVLEFEAIE